MPLSIDTQLMHDDPDIVERPPFDDAIRASDEAASDLETFQDRLDQLAAVEAEIGALRDGVADASEAAKNLSASAERSAAIHNALEQAVQSAVARHEETLAGLADGRAVAAVQSQASPDHLAQAKALTDAANTARANLANLPGEIREATEAALDRHRSATVLARWEATWLLRAITALAALTFLLVLYQVFWGGSSAPEPDALPLSQMTVQVLNGTSGRDRPVAGQLAAVIRSSGKVAAVLDAANAAHSPGYSETTILTHGATVESGRELAAAIGVNSANVFPGTPAPLNGDLTVVVGDDIDRLGVLPASQREEAPAPPTIE